MSKKSKEEKRRRQKELERKRNYDVLSRAENKAKNPQNPEGLGGYKTSDAFFEDAFGTGNTKPESVDISPVAPAGKTANSVVKGSKQAVKSTGYFFKNLKRELTKSKKNKKNKRKPVKPQDRKPRDYDVFSD